MSAPTDNPLDRLCRLARLRPPTTGRDELERRLKAVVSAFADLREVDTGGVVDATPPPGRLRADEPGPVLTVEEALANSANKAADCFLVPRVVEG